MPPDSELWGTGYIRAFLQGRSEPYAAGVSVVKVKPTTNKPRLVQIRRDGGPLIGVFDHPRLTVRVFADVDQEASDLARLVMGAFKIAALGSGPVVALTSLSGPNPIPDSSQPQYVIDAELMMRCTVL
jgi:hypothetical protein